MRFQRNFLLTITFLLAMVISSFGYTPVRLGPEYFPESDRGRPVANGEIYVGKPDLDPEVIANQIQVYIQKEDGTIVAVAQPIYTSAGGVPVYEGSPVTILTNSVYSLKVNDKHGAQVYYVPKADLAGATVGAYYYPSSSAVDHGVIGNGDTIKHCVDTIGTTNKGTIYLRHDSGSEYTVYTLSTDETIPENIKLEIECGAKIKIANGITLTISGPFEAELYQVFDCVGTGVVSGLKLSYPEFFGAKGDGVTDDSIAILQAINSLLENGLLKFQPLSYSFSYAHLTKSITIDLNGATLEAMLFSSGVSKNLFYSEATDAVEYIEIKNGKIDGNGTNSGITTTDRNSLILIIGAGVVKINNIEEYQHSAGLAMPYEVLVNHRNWWAMRFLDCQYVYFDSNIMHDNWNEQLCICSDSKITHAIVTNSYWYNSDVNPAYSPMYIINTASARVENNILIDNNTSAIGVLSNNSIIRGNYIDGVTHSVGINTSERIYYVDNVIIENNTIKNAVCGGIWTGGTNIKICNNTIEKCKGGIIVHNRQNDETTTTCPWQDYGHRDLNNILIEGNTILDTREISGAEISEPAAISIVSEYSGFYYRDIRIVNNYISQPSGNIAGYQLQFGIMCGSTMITAEGGVDDIEIKNNHIYDSKNYSFCANIALSKFIFKENRINTLAADNSDIILINFPSGTPVMNTFHIYENNIFDNIPSYATTHASNRYNILFGPYVNISDVKIINNINFYTFHAMNVSQPDPYYLKNDYPIVSGIPTSGSYNAYDIIKKIPVSGSVEGYVIMNSGTFGTLNGGATTGTINAGSNLLVVNDATGISIGEWLTVNGSGTGEYYVKHISGLNIYLNKVWAYGNPVSQPVAYSIPLVKTIGTIN